MLRPARMRKIRILTPKDYFDDVIRSLANTKAFHQIDVTKELEGAEAWKGLLRPVEPSDLIPRCTTLLSKIDYLLKKMEVPETVPKPSIEQKSFAELISDAEREVSGIEEEYERITSRLEEIRGLPKEATRKAMLTDELKRLAETKGSKLLVLREALRRGKEFEEAKLATAETKYASFIEGWIPAKKEEEVRRAVEQTSKGHCIIETRGPEEHEEPPILLENPSFARAFQRLVVSYGLPKYREIDPTIVGAITFPIVFSFMFADVGHGILLTLLGILSMIGRKRRELPEMLRMVTGGAELFLACGICSVVTGLMFGEFFGFHIKPPLGFILEFIPGIGYAFSPIKEPMKMFKLALMIGAAHIGLGLFLALASKLLNREYKEAITGPFFWLWFYVGFMYFVLSFKTRLDLWVANAALFIVLIFLPMSLIFIGRALMGEDFMEGFAYWFEAMIASLSHTISYGRILALAMAHAIMSSMFAGMAKGLPELLGATILLAGTILVMLIEGLIIFVHTLRLHWIEWFSKFYEGGGIEFKSLALSSSEGS